MRARALPFGRPIPHFLGVLSKSGDTILRLTPFRECNREVPAIETFEAMHPSMIDGQKAFEIVRLVVVDVMIFVVNIVSWRDWPVGIHPHLPMKACACSISEQSA